MRVYVEVDDKESGLLQTFEIEDATVDLATENRNKDALTISGIFVKHTKLRRVGKH